MGKYYSIEEFITKNQEHFSVEEVPRYAKPISAIDIEKMGLRIVTGKQIGRAHV